MIPIVRPPALACGAGHLAHQADAGPAPHQHIAPPGQLQPEASRATATCDASTEADEEQNTHTVRGDEAIGAT